MFVVATEPVKDGNSTVGSVQVTKSITITSGKVTYKAAGRFSFNLSTFHLIPSFKCTLSNKRPLPYKQEKRNNKCGNVRIQFGLFMNWQVGFQSNARAFCSDQ